MDIRTCLAAALAALVAFAASAQQAKTVGGIVVNIGIVRAIDAEHVDSQHGVHKGGHASGTQHVVVSLAHEKGGARIADAEVTIEVKTPKGAVQRKAALGMFTAGFPDYSEVFDFGNSGTYTVRVRINRKGLAKPVEAAFEVRHMI